MSVADELNARKERLQTILDECNTAITDKGGTEVEDLNGLSSAIAELSGGSGAYQEKSVTPTGEEIVVTPDEGYDAMTKVTVDGDSNLKPWNIPDGITIFGVVGTLKVDSSEIPADLPVSKAEADHAYEENVGEAPPDDAGLMVLVSSSGNITYGYLAEDFTITEYDQETTDFKAVGWKRLSYHVNGPLAGTWTYDDFSSTASGGQNYVKNIRSCSREKLYYNGDEVWPERYVTVFDEDIVTHYNDDGNRNGYSTSISVLCTDEPLTKITRACRMTVDGVSAELTLNCKNSYSSIGKKVAYYYEAGNTWLDNPTSTTVEDDGYDFLFDGHYNFLSDHYIVWISSRIAGTYHVKLEIKM